MATATAGSHPPNAPSPGFSTETIASASRLGAAHLTLSEPGGLPDREPIDTADVATRVEGEGAPHVLDVAVLWGQPGTLQGDVPGCGANHRLP